MVTAWVVGNCALQAGGQSIPAGDERTCPTPVSTRTATSRSALGAVAVSAGASAPRARSAAATIEIRLRRERSFRCRVASLRRRGAMRKGSGAPGSSWRQRRTIHGPVTQVVDDSLESGRQAAQRHAWRDAYALLQSADAEGRLTADDLESLAEAAWWTGRLDEAIALRERAYAAYVQAGEKRKAAAIALTISTDNLTRGSMSVSGGWLARAERLLADEPEAAEHGHVALVRGLTAFDLGDLETARREVGKAQELGARFGDRNLEALALVFKGHLLVATGEIDEGLALLDEATAAALSGELQPLATGIVYCITIDSCQALGDCGRAAEWTDEANRWCDRLDVTGFPGACRIHRAEILRLRGEWPKAEEQAVQACEELHDYNHFVTAAGYYEIGEIQRRRGDFAAPAEGQRKDNELGRG